MGVQYLVDFENVHEAGLCGMDALTDEDSVFIFHTNPKEKICLSRLDDVRAWVRVIPVPPGNQSLDMHLVSFLGYQIGKEEEGTKYAIVSHDRDYQGVIAFWNRTFRENDKVYCVPGIAASLADETLNSYFPDDTESAMWRVAVREYIVRMFEKYGVISLSSMPGMLVSELCTKLNALPEYNLERKRTGKKAMDYLITECNDIVQVRRQWGQDWAYLLYVRQGDCVSQPAAAAPVVSSFVAEPVDEAPEPDVEENALHIACPQEDMVAEDENVPDIMELGDLAITDPAADEEAMPAKPESTAISEEADTVETAAPAPDIPAIALAFVQEPGDAERNEAGHVRASALRDRLMEIPEFRVSLKESGMKPIPYIAQQFEGYIEVYREKGTYWAVEARKKTIDERKMQYREKAVNYIRNRLSDAGVDQSIAEEIAGVCLRYDSDGDWRKAVHLLLCQRFGPRIGAKYYRQAVKYLSA